MTIMYLGPNINGLVRKNQIFTYYPEKVIEEACGVEPLAKHLFIRIDEVTDAKRELSREGSFLSIIYNKIKNRRK